MATTHSANLGIKLIGTGLEAGTWGDSTSQNFKRVEDVLGRAVSIDPTAMPGPGDTDGSGDAVTPATWVLLDAADSDGASSDSGAEGRCSAVEFKGTLTGIQDIEIRGATSSTEVNRQLFVWNNTTGGYSIRLEAAGGYLTIPNGSMVPVQVVSATTGGWTAGVHNLLDQLSVSDITLSGATGSITFVGDATITVEANEATALTITDGTTNLAVLDTTTAAEKLILDAAATEFEIDASTNSKNLVISLGAASATALTITDGTNAFITVDSVADEVEIGTSGAKKDLRLFSDIVNMSNQATILNVITGSTTGLRIADGGTEYITIDTSNTRIDTDVELQIVDDITMAGSTGYVNFASTKGETGYGLRNNSGEVESKHSTSSTWNPLVAALVGVDRAGSATQAIGAAASGNGKEGCIDIGPVRIIFNTVVANTGGKTITLGDAPDGTGASFSTTMYTVIGCMATNASEDLTIVCSITDAAAGTFVVRSPSASHDVTYIAIGDSGA